MNIAEWKAARAKAASDLGLEKPTHQDAHLLLVVRETKRLHEKHDGDWKKVYEELDAIGYGFGKNASQFNQKLDKEPKSGGAAKVAADLDI